MSATSVAPVLASSSGNVAAWIITALLLLLLAAVLWSFVRRSGTVQALEVDRLDEPADVTPVAGPDVHGPDLADGGADGRQA